MLLFDMRYLYKQHFTDIEGYCVARCKKIVLEHTSSKLWYYRGLYKGYSYVMKVSRYYKLKRSSIPYFVIQNLLKESRHKAINKFHPEPDYQRGISEALYDCMNYTQSFNVV